MANTSDPYRRLGANSWEELLDQVNDELENPPSGCDPIDPIEAPGESHRWAKSDVREVHDKLDEMPGDCFTFEDIPDLWKISIIEDIETQLSESWCDCDEEFCCHDCPDCELGVEILFLGTETVGPNQCTECSSTNEDQAFCRESRGRGGDYKNALALYGQRNVYAGRQRDWCNFLDELAVLELALEKLEDQLAVLEQQLADCGTNQACIDAKQAQIDDKQEEVDDKQEEVDDKQEEVDDAESDWQTAKSVSDGGCAAILAAYNAMIDSCGRPLVYDLVAPFNRPLAPGLVDVCFDADNASPDGPTPFCCNRHWWNCNILWALSRKSYNTVRTACNGNAGIIFVSGFRSILRGSFDIDGTPCPTSLVYSACPAGHLTHYCYSNCCCCGNVCGTCCHRHPNNDYNYDYELRIVHKRCRDSFDCDGGPCGDGVSG